jgi:hypothetical protein
MDKELAVYDLLGQEISRKKFLTNTVNIDVSGFSTGIYIARLNLPGTSLFVSERFVVQH